MINKIKEAILYLSLGAISLLINLAGFCLFAVTIDYLIYFQNYKGAIFTGTMFCFWILLYLKLIKKNER